MSKIDTALDRLTGLPDEDVTDQLITDELSKAGFKKVLPPHITQVRMLLQIRNTAYDSVGPGVDDPGHIPDLPAPAPRRVRMMNIVLTSDGDRFRQAETLRYLADVIDSDDEKHGLWEWDLPREIRGTTMRMTDPAAEHSLDGNYVHGYWDVTERDAWELEEQ